jgi:hypothetical protein
LIFISHSSRNNDKAEVVRDWLADQGWGFEQIYLDLTDLHSGERWRRTLNEIGANCEAVIACLSDDWLRSPECLREFNHAESGGKPIFPVIVEPITERIPSFITDLQFANIVDEKLRGEGFERLRHDLLAARIGPQYFPWPPPGEPNRSVYRGLQALEERDAAILFGRDVAITKGLDDLRRLRGGAPERSLIVLGASGAGKSSFLRAGLIARLRRDDHNFLVLPVIRPEIAALTGASGLQVSLATALGTTIDLGAGADALTEALAALRAPVMQRLQRIAQAVGATDPPKPPTIVFPIDQAEELYDTENVEAARFLELLAETITSSDALAIFAIRSDSYAQLQIDIRLEAAAPLLFSLPPIAIGEFKEVIEGPARLARPPIEIENELTQQLLADIDATDALPLLAFTLERLKTDYGTQGRLTLSDYLDRLGGLDGAIRGAFDAAVGANPEMLTLARRAFVPALVQVDQEGVKRRIAKLSDFPAAVVALVERLVGQRLLVSDRRPIAGQMVNVVEVAHEAILRQWPPLVSWIEEERDSLRSRDILLAAAMEWRAHGEVEVWLVHRGTRLADAEELTEKEDFAPTITADALAYLSACRAIEDEALRRAARQRTRRQLVAGLAVGVPAIAGAGVGGAAFWRNYQRSHSIDVTFDDVGAAAAASSAQMIEIPAAPYLVTRGMSLAQVSPDRCRLVIQSSIGTYGGHAVASRHYLTEIADPWAAPMSYTLRFHRRPKSIGLVRAALLAATESGVTHPSWTAQAFDAAGRQIDSVGEDLLRSFANVPAKTFLLQAFDRPIDSLRVTSDFRLYGVPFAGFQAALMQAFQLQF